MYLNAVKTITSLNQLSATKVQRKGQDVNLCIRKRFTGTSVGDRTQKEDSYVYTSDLSPLLENQNQMGKCHLCVFLIEI